MKPTASQIKDDSYPSLVEVFLTALQFLTIFPPVIKRPFKPLELGRSVGFYPLVGLLLGAVLSGTYILLLFIFPRSISLSLVLVAWVIFSGALHLDGFLDTCDGLFGGRTPEERLQIMRDEHLGAYAFAGGILLFLLKIASLTSVSNPYRAILLAPVISRWTITFSIIKFPYARTEGLGRTIKENAGNKELVIATFTTLIATIIIAGWQGLIVLAVAALTVLGLAKFTLRLIPGLSGDVYGAISELVEVVVVLVLCLRFLA